MNPIRNIPTDLLRALVTVVDLKGFTRAGERLGRSQPAISLQIKRLQELLGVELFDREIGNAQLNEFGQIILSYARRILSLNDEMLARIDQKNSAARVRLGMTESYAYYLLPLLFADDKERDNGHGYEVTCDLSANLLAGLDRDEFDLVLAYCDETHQGELLSWSDETIWIGTDASIVKGTRPVPLVAFPNDCVLRRLMTETLSRASRNYEIVMTTPSLISMKSALDAGIAITAISSRVYRNRIPRLPDDCGLPRLPDMRVGLYVRDNGNSVQARALAERISGFIGMAQD